jgi:hypothetical protein
MVELNMLKDTHRTPPYVEYSAFKLFLDAIKLRLPEKIDIKYLRQINVAKSAQRTLLVSLRSLDFIDMEGSPTLLLGSLLKNGDEFIANLQGLVQAFYNDLLSKKDWRSFARSEISEYFQNKYDLSPNTAYSCASFFVRLARDAKLLPDKKGRTTGRRTGHAGIFNKGSANRDAAAIIAMKAELLKKLPDFKNGWQPADVQKVLEQFDKLISHLE